MLCRNGRESQKIKLAIKTDICELDLDTLWNIANRTRYQDMWQLVLTTSILIGKPVLLGINSYAHQRH